MPKTRFTAAASTICLILGAMAGAAEPAPWQAAGITERQAAAHVLNRLTFGPRPGEVEAVLDMGLETWFEAQLAMAFPEAAVERRTPGVDPWFMSSDEIIATYPLPPLLLREATQAGVIPEDLDPAALKDPENRSDWLSLVRWASSRGYRRPNELLEELTNHKFERAVAAENQLAEVLTDFWFNHFNVSVTDPAVRLYVLQYERDAIRPNVLGSFRGLLRATAGHPAMLLYLDNAMSVSDASSSTTMDMELEKVIAPMTHRRRSVARSRVQRERRKASERPDRPTGLNENYARELLELHTLGVDGGYGQADVIEVARAFTGWAILPPGAIRQDAEQRLAKVQTAGGLGFVRDGDFLFRADAHDADSKVVLGQFLPAGRGIEDGENVLDILASHPATAQHIATKLATRFVSDAPAVELVDRLATIFANSDGDISDVLRTLFASPEFWAEAVRPTKVKMPFELVVSAVRSVDGELYRGSELADWTERMGQRLYACAPPTGWPETGDPWLGASSVVARSTFAFDLADDRVGGVTIPTLSRAGTSRTSVAGAVEDLGPMMLPGRDLSLVVSSVEPGAASLNADREAIALILSSPEFQRR